MEQSIAGMLGSRVVPAQTKWDVWKLEETEGKF